MSDLPLGPGETVLGRFEAAEFKGVRDYVVTNVRFIMRFKKGGFNQIFLRDITSILPLKEGFLRKQYTVYIATYGASVPYYCTSEKDMQEMANVLQRAMLQVR